MGDLTRQRAATVAVWRADVATRPGGAWTDLGGLALHATGLPRRYWNGAHLTSAEGLSHLGSANQWFADRELPWGVLVPAELGLEPPCFAHVHDQPVMLLDLANLPPLPEVDLDWGGEDGWRVQAAAFGEPDDLSRDFVVPKLVNAACSLVVAYVDGLPVATGTGVHVDGVVGVYGVGTVASHRRRGLGRAVTLAVLHEAVRRGCDLAFLNPSPLGYAVYVGLGFEDAPPWRVFIPSE